jgi:hypothetical protein
MRLMPSQVSPQNWQEWAAMIISVTLGPVGILYPAAALEAEVDTAGAAGGA